MVPLSRALGPLPGSRDHTDCDMEQGFSVALESLHFELGLLKILNPCSTELGLLEVGGCIPTRTKKRGAIDLLGPLIMYQRDGHSEVDWGKAHLPWAAYWASETLSWDLTRALENSTVYAKEDITRILLAVGAKQKSQSPRLENNNHTIDNGRRKPGDAWTSVTPSHVDLSCFRAYYSELNLIPPYKSSIDEVKNSERTPWVVRMGDVVMVHCDGAKRSPMECNWGGRFYSDRV